MFDSNFCYEKCAKYVFIVHVFLGYFSMLLTKHASPSAWDWEGERNEDFCFYETSCPECYICLMFLVQWLEMELTVWVGQNACCVWITNRRVG